jgi:hypothetical protein
MIPADTATLRDRLIELADAVGAKAPGEPGVKAWYIALKDFAIDDIVGALDHWLRNRPKMPSPSDIRVTLAERKNSQRARDELNALPVLELPGFGVKRSTPDSPAYLQFKAWWAEFRRDPPATTHPDTLGSFVRVGAIFAPDSGRPLSESERELREERRAIQAEGA